MRKLILLALAGALVAYLIRNRSEPQPAWSATEAATSGYAPGPESAAEAPPTEEVAPEPEDEQAESLAAGDRIYFSHHVLLWMDSQVKVSAMSMKGAWKRTRGRAGRSEE